MPKNSQLILLIVLSITSVLRAERPNVVFIMTDDQAPWAIGLYDKPTHANTPNLDKLFRAGTYLPNTFVVTPVCSPSRASLATSRYGTEVGVTEWLNPRVEADHGLDPSTQTWYEVMQNAGYFTGLVGKWHLGLLDKYHPTKTGFDYFMGHRGGGWSPVNPTLEVDGQNKKIDGLTTDILTDHAISFIENRPDNQPFLLVLHYRAPHARWLPVAPEDMKPFEKLDPKLPTPDFEGLDVQRVKRFTREYLASTRGVDRNVGRLLETLDESGLRENTVIVFTSDHGYNMGHNGIWHKGNGHWILKKDSLPLATENIPAGQRPNMYDNSLRVPTCVVWPGVTKPGTRIDSSVTNLDWYPTMQEIAGGSSAKKKIVRGRDLSTLLTGSADGWDDEVFAQYSTRHQSKTHMRCYRTSKWKLVRDFNDPQRDELFNLIADPSETTNLIDQQQHQAIVTLLHAKLLSKMKEINDPALP